MDQAPTLQERQVAALEGIQAAMWVLIQVIENRIGPDYAEPVDEPDMFATLNGPRTTP